MQSLPIMYEDDSMLVIDKPSSLAVQGGNRVSQCVPDVLQEQLGHKVWLVHRLDKETSGLLVVAKTAAAASELTMLLARRGVKKVYTALCLGRPDRDEGRLNAPITVQGVRKDALTFFTVLEARNGYSMLSLELGTGRTHQIRIHLAGIGCPILGDDKYGNFPLNKTLRKEQRLKRLLLHSSHLELPGPKGALIVLDAPLPPVFEQVHTALLSPAVP